MEEERTMVQQKKSSMSLWKQMSKTNKQTKYCISKKKRSSAHATCVQ